MKSVHTKIKAVILTAGEGTRLRPLTLVTNKNLLPLYDKPVVCHAIEHLVAAGIQEIMIVTSPKYVDQFKALLGDGGAQQVKISYGVQEVPKGIAHGFKVARDFVGNDNSILWLGDNVLGDDISEDIKSFSTGAKVFLKKVSNPKLYGVATVDKDMNVTEIIEKPSEPKSDLAVIGVYLFDNSVWKKMEKQTPSARGEYEVTYLTNAYAEEGTLKAAMLAEPWFDVGNIDNLLEASNYMQKKKKAASNL
jgi:glucose-1-phosphate thymidylyltransferase